MPGFYALYRYGLTEVLDTDSQAGKPLSLMYYKRLNALLSCLCRRSRPLSLLALSIFTKKKSNLIGYRQLRKLCGNVWHLHPLGGKYS